MNRVLASSIPVLALLTAGTHFTGIHWYSYLLFATWACLTTVHVFTVGKAAKRD